MKLNSLQNFCGVNTSLTFAAHRTYHLTSNREKGTTFSVRVSANYKITYFCIIWVQALCDIVFVDTLSHKIPTYLFIARNAAHFNLSLLWEASVTNWSIKISYEDELNIQVSSVFPETFMCLQQRISRLKVLLNLYLFDADATLTREGNIRGIIATDPNKPDTLFSIICKQEIAFKITY